MTNTIKLFVGAEFITNNGWKGKVIEKCKNEESFKCNDELVRDIDGRLKIGINGEKASSRLFVHPLSVKEITNRPALFKDVKAGDIVIINKNYALIVISVDEKAKEFIASRLNRDPLKFTFDGYVLDIQLAFVNVKALRYGTYAELKADWNRE